MSVQSYSTEISFKCCYHRPCQVLCFKFTWKDKKMDR